MKNIPSHNVLIPLVVLLSLFIGFPGHAISTEPPLGNPSRQGTTPGQAEHNSLGRDLDPIVVESEVFGGCFDGEKPGSIGLYAYTEDGFGVIPYQFDFIGEDGLVVPGFVNRVREMGVYDFIVNKDYPERLAGRFQLLFMAVDSGDRYPEEEIPPGFSRFLEIMIQDPLTGDKAWAYLMKPDTPPAPAKNDFVDYRLISNNGQSTEQIDAVSYTTGFPNAHKPFAYGTWMIPEDAGGAGIDILQTFRVRIKIKILFLTLDLDPKDNIIPYVLGYNDGPIRVTRRVFSSILIKGVKMDRFLGNSQLETESHYYRDYFYFDGEVSLPAFLKKISTIEAMFTTDFSPAATGLIWYNAKNPAHQGCLVDGRMSPQELALNQDPYLWSLLVGDQGGWANILQVHTESIKPNMKLFYRDDSSYICEKDPNLNGTWGSTGYYLDRLDEVEDMARFRTNIFAISRTFGVQPDVNSLVRLVYHPLETSVTRRFQAGR